MAGPHILRAPACLALNEETRPELVEFGTANLRAENIRQFRDGEASSRFGFTWLPTTRTDATSATAGYKLFADKNSIVRITDTMQAEAFSIQAQAWKPLGRVPEVSQRLIDTATISLATPNGALVTDFCYCNGYFISAWLSVNGGAPFYNTITSVSNASTGTTVRVPELIGAVSNTNSRPLLACYGVYVVVFWAAGANGISAMYLDTTSVTSVAAGWVALGGATVITDKSGGSSIYAVHSLTDRVAILYANNAGGVSQATCKTLDITGVLQSQTLNTNSILPSRVALSGTSTDTLWCTWAETTVIAAQGLTPGTLSVTKATKATIMTMLSGTAMLGIAQGATAGTARVIANDTAGTQLRMRSIVTTAGAAAASGLEIRVPSANMTQRPWQYGGRYYVTVSSETTQAATTQKTVTVVDFTDAVTYLRPVALFAPGLVTPNVCTSGFCDSQSTAVVGPSSTKVYLLVQVTKSGAADASQILELDYASPNRWTPAYYGNSTFLSGGILTSFDSVRVAEVGFIYRPPTPTTSTGGTGITAITGWRYVCVYEEVDANGNWAISGLSSPSISTGAVANKTVTVTSQPLSITARLNTLPVATNGARIAIYRTLDGAVAPYYRVGTTPNDTSGLTVTFADNVPDATIALNAKLYAQPGIVGTAQDRRVPPGFSSVVSHNGMLVGASGSDVWFSGQNVAGEAAWFNPIFQIPIPGPGDITSLAVMDGSLYVFKRREVYILAGDAPSDNGSTGGLGLPRRLACDVGSIESRATCTTALGIFFQSERGIEILTRAQSVEWIGAKMWVTVLAFPVCTSITVEPISNSVIVELAASESAAQVSGGGRTLIYDLSSNSWVSTDRRKSALALADCPSQSACVVYNGSAFRYAWLSASGYVHVEDRTTYLDADGTFVVSLVETGWFNAYQNEQRGRTASVIFQRYTASGLKVETAYDYGDYNPLDPASNAVWTEVDTLGQRQLELGIKPRGETMKFRITATAPSALLGTGQGISFFGVVLDLGEKQGPTRGTTRLPPALRR